MINWLKNKIKNNSVDRINTYLTSELSKIDPPQIAYIAIHAIVFCESLCQGFEDIEGYELSRAILSPSNLSRSEAQNLFSQLENLLENNNKQNKEMLSRPMLGGEETKEKLKIKFNAINAAICLLMIRISYWMNTKNNAPINEISNYMKQCVPYIEDATNLLRQEHICFNSEKSEDYYELIKTRANSLSSIYPL